ncbi:hypothetical protein BKA63DRAFT_6393 [Paraphoma chrysanthemicola]|nr:hypothetical protein BKA63DRAFT_6393 [Paraphoma chrysanthemicola]
MATSKETASAKAPLVGNTVSEGIVIVAVGKEGTPYHVHKALLIHHSDYFRKALSGPWKEAREGLVTLEDVEPSTFTIFCHWLYTQKFPENESEWEALLSFDERLDWRDEGLQACAAGYALGDRLMAQSFRRATIETAVTQFDGTYFADSGGRAVTSFAFATLPASCGLLQFLGDSYCANSVKDEDSTLAAQDELPRAFLRRVLLRFQELSLMTDEEQGEEARCYLEHESEQEKNACEKEHIRYDEKKDLAIFFQLSSGCIHLKSEALRHVLSQEVRGEAT